MAKDGRLVAILEYPPSLDGLCDVIFFSDDDEDRLARAAQQSRAKECRLRK